MSGRSALVGLQVGLFHLDDGEDFRDLALGDTAQGADQLIHQRILAARPTMTYRSRSPASHFGDGLALLRVVSTTRASRNMSGRLHH